VTDDDLGAPLRKLEEAEYVSATKAFVDRKPVTRFKTQLAAMSGLIQAANGQSNGARKQRLSHRPFPHGRRWGRS
jgi:hypothetical protein